MFSFLPINAPNFDVYDVRVDITRVRGVGSYVNSLVFSIRNNGGTARDATITINGNNDRWPTKNYYLGTFPPKSARYDIRIDYSILRPGLQIALTFEIEWNNGSQKLTRVIPL